MLDAILGLPFLSFLLIPTFTSYSTSLNLLFFYLTWSTLVLSHPPLRVEIVASLAVRSIFYIAPSLIFLAFDTALPSAAQNLKALGSTGLPFRNASRNRTLRTLRMLGWSIFNTCLGITVQALTEVLFTRVLLIRSALRVTTTLPLPFGILKDLAKAYLLREVLTYTIHRYVLHESNNILSRAHRDWYHVLATPFPLTATYDHPVSYLLRSFLPTYIPAILFRFHLTTYILYLILTSLEETFAYSGYSTVPTNFILGGIARRTDTHVVCGGDGNFGPWGLVDWFMGTSVGADVLDDVVMEAEKHDVPAKVNKGRKKANGKVEGAKGVLGRRKTRQRSDS
jgi:sterol desaturase/sphingolipid hydroxylase (fatty acid hydroxylase superfamily)